MNSRRIKILLILATGYLFSMALQNTLTKKKSTKVVNKPIIQKVSKDNEISFNTNDKNNSKLINTNRDINKPMKHYLKPSDSNINNTNSNLTTNSINNQVASRSSKLKYIEREFILTFYTTLPSENGGYTVNCKGEKLKNGMVANNVLPLGTKILLPKHGVVEVSDHGGREFNNSNRLDVLIERHSGESNSQYYKRVNNMGRQTVKGYIIKESK